MDQTREIWLDRATGMLFEFDTMRAREFVVDPEIDKNTFSTKPPAGAEVHVIKAIGKEGPTPPNQYTDELNPEDAHATIESTSPIPIYYLGPEFEGAPLSEVSIFDDVSGSEVSGDLAHRRRQGLTIWHGEDFQMITTQFALLPYRNSVGRSRLCPSAVCRQLSGPMQSHSSTPTSSSGLEWPTRRQATRAAAALVEVGNGPRAPTCQVHLSATWSWSTRQRGEPGRPRARRSRTSPSRARVT